MSCIEAKGVKTPKGYGRVHIKGKNMLAHRWAWEQAHGDPGDQCVLHKCDNPACINVDHLFLGTRTDNQQDMKNKGRGRKPTYSHDRMRECLESGMTHKATSEMLGCSRAAVTMMLRRSV